MRRPPPAHETYGHHTEPKESDMTTSPATGPAAGTTASAREILPVLLAADPYIPEAHDDEDEPYRDDVRDVLTAQGWTEDHEGFLRKDGALWTETNEHRESGLDGPDKGFVIQFTREVPAPVVIAACLAAAGVDVPDLLAEVDRLRAELASSKAAHRAVWEQCQARGQRVFDLQGENGRLRADRARLAETTDACGEEIHTLRARVAELECERATHRAERDAEITAWLRKKARDYRSIGSRQHAMQADAIETMASTISRGAVRPNNTRGGAE